MISDLTRQYNNLSDREKKSLLVYKSRLGLLINDIDANPEYDKYYDEFKEILDNPVNVLVKKTIFDIVDLSSIDDFKKSIIDIKKVLDEVTSKMVLNSDIEVYRAISSNEKINGLSKSNIISTSLSFGETLKFANAGNNIEIYHINLEKGSKIAFIPYSVVYNEKDKRLIVTNSQNQDEIVLNKNIYDFELVDKMEVNKDLNIVEVNAISKNKEKTKI